MLRCIARAAACLAFALCLSSPLCTHAAPPLLYVYEGSGCTGMAQLPQFRAFLGRQEDGVTDFNAYGDTASAGASEADWALGCWQGQVKNVSYALGLAFSDTTIAQVAAGAADAQYAHIAASLVSHGFAHAYVRLGWEMNGGWYPWGQKGATFVSAFNHVAPIIKAGCPGCTIVLNPAMDADPSTEMPGAANVGAIGPDVYATSWIGGSQTEPALWSNNLTGWYGVGSFLPSQAAYAKFPIVIPEFGVGSRSDGHGACSGTTANACDDPTYMASALSYFGKMGAALVGYWDYDAGDYNSMISDGSRPHEALAFLSVFGSAGMKAIFNAYASTFTTQTAPTLTVVNCHAVAIQNGANHWMIVVWATGAHPSASVSWSGKTTNSNFYSPAAANPTTPIKALGAVNSWTGVLTPNQQIVIAIAQ